MLNDLLFRLRALFRRDAMEAEMDEELRSHFENQVKKLVASGLPLVRRPHRLLYPRASRVDPIVALRYE